jgi:hypothetical protein
MAFDRIPLTPARAAAADLHGKAGRRDAVEAAERCTPAGLVEVDWRAVLDAGPIRRQVIAPREVLAEGTRP